MRVTTKATYDIETGRIISWEGYEYSGPVELCGGDKKKARQLTTDQMTLQAGNSATDRAAAATARTNSDAELASQKGSIDKIQKTADSLTSTAPGKMDPYAEANYSSTMNDIASSMAKQREMGFRAIGAGGAMPGSVSSMTNNIAKQQGTMETGAYRNALLDTLNDNLTGTNLNKDIAGMYGGRAGFSEARANTVGAQSLNESNNSVNDAATRVKMGSTAGDVLSGIGQVADIATSIAAPGFGMVKKSIKNIANNVPLSASPHARVPSFGYAGSNVASY